MDRCKRCHRKGLRLNQKGYCLACAMKRIGEACHQLQTKQGPFYRRWLKGMRKARRRMASG